MNRTMPAAILPVFSRRSLPPGPGFVPTLRSLPLSRRGPLALFQEWAQRYGDVCCYRAAGGPVCILSAPADVEEVLVTKSSVFIKGRGSQLNRRLLGNGLLTSEGSGWLHQRRLMQPAFHAARLSEYARSITGYTKRMLGGWRAGETRNLHREMTRLTLEIVLKILFHTEFTDYSQDLDSIIDQVLQHDERPGVLKQVHKLLPMPTALRYLMALRRLDAFVYRQIRERSRSGGSGDLVSMMLAARDEDGNAMTEQQVRDEVMTFVGAGYETTSLTLCFALYLLSQNPEVESRLAAEIDCLLGGRPPQAEDLPRLEYTEKVVKESMRLFPPAWAISRDSTEPVEIGGYRFPAGACFFLNMWTIHRDSRFYHSPDRFEPDRWTPDFARQLPRYAYFPFGGGQRMCIGAGFAKLETALILAAVVQKFRLSPAPGWRLRLDPAVVLRPKGGVHMRLMERS